MTRSQFGVMCGLLGLIVVLLALPILAPDRTAPRYEYKIEEVKDLEFLPEMERFGRGGWDLVFARRAMGEGKEMAYEMIFKRPK